MTKQFILDKEAAVTSLAKEFNIALTEYLSFTKDNTIQRDFGHFMEYINGSKLMLEITKMRNLDRKAGVFMTLSRYFNNVLRRDKCISGLSRVDYELSNTKAVTGDEALLPMFAGFSKPYIEEWRFCNGVTVPLRFNRYANGSQIGILTLLNNEGSDIMVTDYYPTPTDMLDLELSSTNPAGALSATPEVRLFKSDVDGEVSINVVNPKTKAKHLNSFKALPLPAERLDELQGIHNTNFFQNTSSDKLIFSMLGWVHKELYEENPYSPAEWWAVLELVDNVPTLSVDPELLTAILEGNWVYLQTE